MTDAYSESKHRFIHTWGEMGSKWGINKTMAQIHALLMVSEKPLSTDDIMKDLAISRGNANMNLRALVDWGLVHRVFIRGNRKEHFESEKDVWDMFCRIARERKKREIEPAIERLEECLALVRGNKSSGIFRQKLSELLDFMKTGDSLLGKIAKQEKNAVLPRLLKLLN